MFGDLRADANCTDQNFPSVFEQGYMMFSSIHIELKDLSGEEKEVPGKQRHEEARRWRLQHRPQI